MNDPFVVKRCHNFQMKLILNFFGWFGLAGGHDSCHDGQHDGHNGCAGKKEVGGPPWTKGANQFVNELSVNWSCSRD